MRYKVGIHGFAESRKEVMLTEAGEESETLEFVFNRILHLCKAQFDTGRVQGFI